MLALLLIFMLLITVLRLNLAKKTAGVAGNNGTKHIEIIVSLKCLSNFLRTLEIPFINCEIHLVLTWSDKCMLSNHTEAATVTITDTKRYTPVLTLSTQDNTNLLEQLKSGFKITINWNIYESKLSVQAKSLYLNFLISPRFQGVNQLFVLLFENKKDRKVYIKYYFPLVEINI